MKHNSVWGKILLLVMSVVLALSCLVACNDEEIGALEDANAAIDADLAELEAQLSQTISKLEAAIAKADAAATAEALAAAKAELKALAESNKTGLTAAQTAIADTQAKLEAIEDKLENGITDFTAEINGIKDAVAAIQNDYRQATKVLAGEEKIDGKDYSLVAFDKKVTDFTDSFFGDVNPNFAAWADTVKVSLERATSVEDIKACFATLETEIAKLSDLLGTFKAEVEKIKYVTVEAECLDTVKGIYALIGEYNDEHEVDLVIDADLQTKYDTIVAAHNNLLAAVADAATVDAVDAIAAIGKVVYIDSEDEITAATAAIDAYKLAIATYFENEDYNAWYNLKEDKTDLISNYSTYEAATVRYEQLDAANTDKVTIISVALNAETVRPLWSDKKALDENKALYDAWLAKYEISETADADTIVNIYGNSAALLKASVDYADEMTAIYNNTVFVADKIVGVEALNAAIDTVLANNKPLVLWTELENAEAVGIMIETLANEVSNVDGFDPDKDNNMIEMLTALRLNAFVDMHEAMEELDDLNDALDALYDEYVVLKGNVDFNDGENIENLKNAVATYYGLCNVTEGDANYLAFAEVKDINALIDALDAEYGSLTAKVREIYDAVINYLDPTIDLPLTFGNNIEGYLAEILKIMALTDNVYLDLTQEGDTEEVNLSTLYDNLDTVILKYVEKAEAAQIAANGVNAEIAELLAATTLNNYDAIVEDYDLLTEWIETYLAADVVENDNDVEEALKAVVGIPVFNGADGETYAFVTLADYTKCTKAYNDIVSLINNADVDWAALEAEMDGLLAITTFDIHDKGAFDAARNKWNAYVAEFYGTAIEANTGLGKFEEVTKYNEFMVKYNEVATLCNEATGVKNAIVSGINGLADEINASNYAAELDKIALINANIETYKGYCANAVNENDWCADCLDRALYVQLIRKEALAELYKYAEETKVVAGDNMDDVIDDIVFIKKALINHSEADTTAEVDGALNNAKKAIADKVPCAVPGTSVAHKDNDKNCLCDVCGKALDHVDEDLKDCTCDNCGLFLGHVDENPEDCKCDNCEGALEHTDYEDDYTCGICGAHVCVDIYDINGDENPDGECDDCGQPMA